MSSDNIFLAKNDKTKAFLAIMFPFLLGSISLIPMIFSSFSYAQYFERIQIHNGLLVKFVSFSILGMVGFLLWIRKIVPIALSALKNEHMIVIDSEKKLSFNGHFKLVVQRDAVFSVKRGFLIENLFIKMDGNIFECGNISYVEHGSNTLVQNLNKYVTEL